MYVMGNIWSLEGWLEYTGERIQFFDGARVERQEREKPRVFFRDYLFYINIYVIHIIYLQYYLYTSSRLNRNDFYDYSN